jgi:hypothetical protein
MKNYICTTTFEKLSLPYSRGILPISPNFFLFIVFVSKEEEKKLRLSA